MTYREYAKAMIRSAIDNAESILKSREEIINIIKELEKEYGTNQ